MLVESPHRLVARLEDRFRDLETAFHRAYWDVQVEASSAHERRRAELELELRRFKGDPAALSSVNAALAEELHDSVLRRQLEVLRLSLTGNQMDEDRRAEIVRLSSSVESDFAAFRPEVGGRRLSDNEIDEILQTSVDAELRRRAWAASKQVGALVADRVRELARLRNEVALGLGFADYYRMALELQEMSEPWLFGVLDELDRLTAEPFRAWKEDLDDRLRRRFSTDDLMPWHYADPFFQSLPPQGRVSIDHLLGDGAAADLAVATFAAWGIDISDVIARSDLHPRDLKCQHAFCLDVDRSGRDVRILANLAPGERWVEIMLHECGHAAYDVSIERRLPYLLRRPAHTFVTEAIAILSGRLVRAPEWLVMVAGARDADVAPIEQELARSTRAQNLLFARWVLVMAHFERDLYADPEADLDARWWDLVESFQLVQRPPRTAPDWAAKIHVAIAPVYYHNYLLGHLLASQLEATARRDFGRILAPETGAFLVDRVFRPGSLMRWDALIEEATGRPLSPTDFAAASTSSR